MTLDEFAIELAESINNDMVLGHWDAIQDSISSAFSTLKSNNIPGDTESRFWEQVKGRTQNRLAIKAQGAENFLAMTAHIDKQLALLAQNAKSTQEVSTSSSPSNASNNNTSKRN